MRKTVFTLMTLLFVGGIVNAQSISNCGTDLETKLQRDANPLAFDAAKRAFEASWQEYIKANPPSKAKNKTEMTYIIPVVVHVFHNNGSENLSNAQVASIITRLNQYYNADPSLVSNVRSVFKDIVADVNFEFRLAKKDPQGNCTNGIVRVQTTETYKATQNIKRLSTWDTKKYLNIWTAATVYSNGRLVGGFAQLPYGFSSSITDGLLIDAVQSISGNTVAHEIGHSMGLIHPFEGSDADSCGDGDGVFDTPPTYFLYAEGSVNSGRPDFCADTNYNSCATDNPDLPDMQENIMDYFSGSCSGVMFSLGQAARMKFCLENYRNKLWQTENLIATGVEDGYTCTPAPIANFYMTVPGTKVCVGSNVSFRDDTYNATVTQWAWNFGEGASPATATTATATVTYSTPGWKTVTLTSTGTNGSATVTKQNIIYVESPAEKVTLSSGLYYADWDYINDYLAKGWYFESEQPGNWHRTDAASKDGNHSLMLQTNELDKVFTYSIVSPTFDLSGASNPFINYNYSFAANFLSSSNQNDSRDGLQLLVSYDCGKNWVQKKQTAGNENSPTTPNPLTTASTPAAGIQPSVSYVPVNASQWRNDGISGGTVGSGSQLASVKFKLSFTYKGGNNFYVDGLVVGASGSTGFGELTAKDIQLAIVPNPFSETATLKYTLATTEMVSVKLYDLVGKEIAVLHNGSQTAGMQSVQINKAELGLQSGMYFVKTSVGQNTFSTKVLID